MRAVGEVSEQTLATYRALARATADRALALHRLRPDVAEALLVALAGPVDPPVDPPGGRPGARPPGSGGPAT